VGHIERRLPVVKVPGEKKYSIPIFTELTMTRGEEGAKNKSGFGYFLKAGPHMPKAQ